MSKTKKRLFCRQIYRAFKLILLDRVIKYSSLTQLASSEKVLYLWVERNMAVWKPAIIHNNWENKKQINKTEKTGLKTSQHINPNKHKSHKSQHNLQLLCNNYIRTQWRIIKLCPAAELCCTRNPCTVGFYSCRCKERGSGRAQAVKNCN